MSKESSDVVDVESRVVSIETDHSAVADAEATPALQAVPLEQSLVPALDADKQIALANPALVQLKALRDEIAAAKVETIDVSTKDGEEQVRALLKRCVKLRTGTKAAYDAWNRPLLDAQKGIRKVVTQVEEGITSDETRLAAIVKGIDDAREAEKQRKIEEERARMEALRAKIAGLTGVPITAVRLTSAEIDSKIRELQDLAITDDPASFGEFSDEAEAVRGNVISQLLEMSSAKRAQEEEVARLDALRKQQLEEQRKAEADRALRAKIDAMRLAPMQAMGQPSKKILELIKSHLAAKPLPLVFGDLQDEAMAAWQQAHDMMVAADRAQSFLEQQQAEQARVAAEQKAERERLAAEERKRQEAAAPAPTPTPAPVPAPAPAPAPAAVIDPDEFRLTDAEAPLQAPASQQDHDAITTALGQMDEALAEEPVSDATVLAMSMFLTVEDYFEAMAFQAVEDAHGDEYSSPNQVATDIVETLSTSDFPTEVATELQIVSLLLSEKVLGCLRARRAALIEATTKVNA